MLRLIELIRLFCHVLCRVRTILNIHRTPQLHLSAYTFGRLCPAEPYGNSRGVPFLYWCQARLRQMQRARQQKPPLRLGEPAPRFSPKLVYIPFVTANAYNNWHVRKIYPIVLVRLTLLIQHYSNSQKIDSQIWNWKMFFFLKRF